MATVHRAIERGIEGFERVVALKRLLPHLAEDEGFVRAFVREAKLASLLQHGNIVQLYELGRVGASYFISMEYIAGRDLRVILRQARRVCGPPPVEIALALMTELLDALDYAHSQSGADGRPLGLVHRDISPSNLLVSHTGHLKVIDFGIAKATLGHLMTHTGRIKGKLSYMAPEALSGRTLDGRSDLFSASVIAHELLTATPLFAAKDDFQTIDRLQNMSPSPPSTRNPSCPPELDEIVLRGLAKDPMQRWRSAAEMRAALAELAIDHHRLATNREVADWVEEAFEMPLSSRLRIPATNPGHSVSPPERRARTAQVVDSDDEIMDIVWGITGPRAPMEVLLDDVPDVSARFSRVNDPIESDPLAADPFAADPFERDDVMAAAMSFGVGDDGVTDASARPSFDAAPLAGRQDVRVRFRSGSPQSLSMASAMAERTHGGMVATKTGRLHTGMRPTRPPAWAVGTSRTSQQTPEELLEELVAAARRPESLPPPSTRLAGMAAQQRPSLVPLIVASVAVAGAGAAIAWFLSSGDGRPPPQLVANPPAQAAPPPAPVAPPIQVTPGIAPDTAIDPAEMEPVDDEDDAARDRDRIGDAQRRRPKRDRDAPVAASERSRSRTARAGEAAPIAAAERPSQDRASEPAQVAKSEPPPAAAPDPATQKTAAPAAPAAAGAAKDGAPVNREALPVPAPAPARVAAEPVRAQPAAPRRRAPIVVGPSRTRRVSGSVPPIKFPRWEQAPRQLSVRLCIDPNGAVTSVTVISSISQEVRATLTRALMQWKYFPVVEGDEKVAACFATTLHTRVE